MPEAVPGDRLVPRWLIIITNLFSAVHSFFINLCASCTYTLRSKLPPLPQCRISTPSKSNLPKLPTNTPMPIALDQNLPESLSSSRLHPVVEMLREQELGKAILISAAVPIMIALLFSTEAGKLPKRMVHIVLTVLSLSFVALWNGILLRKVFPRAGCVLERLGLGLVLVSFFILIASHLPVGFLWVVGLCGVLSLVPFLAVAAFPVPASTAFN